MALCEFCGGNGVVDSGGFTEDGRPIEVPCYECRNRPIYQSARMFQFRVWYKPEKRFLDPWSEEDPVFNLRCYPSSKWGVGVAIHDRDHKKWVYIPDDQIVIQQWTGLVDRNDVDIYEGDLVIQDDEHDIKEVRWMETHSGYQFSLCDKYGSDFYGGIRNAEYMMVVGHINSK